MPDQVVPTRAKFRTVTEVAVAGGVPRIAHPEWTRSFPWLCQGSTVPGPGRAFDMGLFGPSASGDVQTRWSRLAESVGYPRIVHARQVHGIRISHDTGDAEGRWVAGEYDGHVTREPATLLTVATADCVPVAVVDPEGKAVALLHAGWRGTAAGIVEVGLAALRSELAVRIEGCHVHLGPSICGGCYEVGPEVHRALGLDVPTGPCPVDLRAALGRRAVRAGVAAANITVSSLCTRCTGGMLYSHRGGDVGRQVAFLGIELEGSA